MKILHKTFSFVLVIILAVAGCFPVTATAVTENSIIEKIIAHNLKATSSDSVQEWIDGYLSDNADNGAEWYIIALSKYGSYDFSTYTNALVKYLSENDVGSASSRLKFALALIASGANDSPFIPKLLEGSVGEQGIMSLIFGLHILNNGYDCKKNPLRSLTDEILSLQSSDGGWSLTGRNGDVDVTAMTVQALAPQYKSNSSVRSAVDKALAFLSACQNSDATYSSYGEKNPESISQVVIALSALGIDVKKDKRFIRNSTNLFDAIEIFSSGDGGYAHRQGTDADETATVQVFCAAVAYKNMKKVASPFYIFSRRSNVSANNKEEKITVSMTQEAVSSSPTTVSESVPTSVSTQQAGVTSVSEEISDEKEEAKKTDCSPKIQIIISVSAVIILLFVILSVMKKIRPKTGIILIVIAVIIMLVAMFATEKPEQEDIIGTVTISIRCDTVKDKDGLSVPEDGVILKETEITVSAGDTVYDVLLQACKENNVHLETTGTQETLYIEGINNIYEKDHGDLSGWMYFVNGASPSVGCGKYKLSDGDEIIWNYTCDLGADLGY